MGISCSNLMTIQEFDLTIEENIFNLNTVEQVRQIRNNDFQQKILDYECVIWDYLIRRWRNTKIQIAFTKNCEIIYLKDGEILRMEKVKENLNKPDILTNYDQIKYLEWIGKHGQNEFKVDKWTANWNGERLMEVGGYYSKDGLKQGIWKELIKNYFKQAQVYELGEYKNSQKIGFWNYQYENKLIRSGKYNNQGQKDGKWIVLSHQFCNVSQVTYNGEYKNGRKVGRWDTFFVRNGKNEQMQNQIFSNRGGGVYHPELEVEDQEQNSIKNGYWIIEQEGYYELNQMIFAGQYNNGKKVGQWDTIYAVYRREYEQFNDKWGGGKYLDSIKIGHWVELCDFYYQNCWVTYEGEYKNGLKVGLWDIKNERSKFGGGQYDVKQKDNIEFSYKTGLWTEEAEGFFIYSMVTHQGYYNEGIKVGQWKSIFKIERELFGGGQYQEKLRDDGVQDSVKIGKWIVFWENFHIRNRIYTTGQYDNNGCKFGYWDIISNSPIQQKNQKNIGGGLYIQNESVGYTKTGSWIEISNSYSKFKKITYSGKYDNGRKVGRWDTFLTQNKKQQLIGGGSYDEQPQDENVLGSIKIGKWIELDEYEMSDLVIFVGVYKNNQKVGLWNEMIRQKKEIDQGFIKVYLKNPNIFSRELQYEKE